MENSEIYIKEVAGHICMNAYWHDTLKQQKVTAWFAMDMPISGGPERFCGLPGTILEIEINDGAMVITADKIEMKSLTTEMDLPKKMKVKESMRMIIIKSSRSTWMSGKQLKNHLSGV